jgi:hypothetical protein
MPKGTDVGFMMPLPFVDERRSKALPGFARAGDIAAIFPCCGIS